MEKKNNILYFCSSSVFGGAERFIETCAKKHTERGDNFALFFLNPGYFFERCTQNQFPTKKSRIRVKLKNPLSWIRFQLYFYRYLKNSTFTHVHLTMAYSQVFASFASFLAGKKIIWFQHGPIGGSLDRIANILPYNHLIFNSEFTKNEHILKAGNIKSPFSILTLAVDVEFNTKQVDQIQLNYPGELFTCMGRICRWKGYEVALNALSGYEKSFTLLILGKPSTDDDKLYLSELIKLTEVLKINDRVHFLGFRENVHDYIKASSALLHTSLEPEPFGLVVAEAINLGVYVYATNLGGIPSQLNKKYLGVVYDGPEYSENLLRLLKMQKHQNITNKNKDLADSSTMISSLNKIYD